MTGKTKTRDNVDRLMVISRPNPRSKERGQRTEDEERKGKKRGKKGKEEMASARRERLRGENWGNRFKGKEQSPAAVDERDSAFVRRKRGKRKRSGPLTSHESRISRKDP